MLEHALQYADRGWFVHPLKVNAKIPATPNGLRDATCDPEVIEQWWTQYPTMNIAVSCGPSNLYVIDIDTKGSDEGVGYRNWFALCDKYNGETEPVTRRHTTPSGGEHHLYLSQMGQLKNTAGKLAPQIDTRGDGGFVVVPPSVIDGVPYTVDVDIDPQPLPAWIVELVTPRPPAVPSTRWGIRDRLDSPSGNYGRRALEGELGRLIVAPEGQRNHQLNTAAFALGQLVAGGVLDDGEVVAALETTATRIGLNSQEIAATIRSGLTSGARQPRRVA